MSAHSRVRKVAVGIITAATYLLVRPVPAAALERGPTCGVCYTQGFCGFNTTEDCQRLCSKSFAGSCGGIPGGWTCLGSGEYNAFVYCGLDEE